MRLIKTIVCTAALITLMGGGLCAGDDQDENSALMADLLAMLNDPKAQEVFEQTQEALDKAPTVTELASQKQESFQKRRDFYQDYIAQYYPKALVICEDHFATMTPEQIAEALRAIIDVFINQPWFYFVDRAAGFKLIHYWEFVVDQLSLIHNFINKTRVLNSTHKLWVAGSDDELMLQWAKGGSLLRESTPLADYLIDLPNTPFFDLYALSFDFVIKLFNEGILLQSPGQATAYFAELEFVMEKLHGSAYEPEYHEHLTTAQELLTLLKHRLGLNEQDAAKMVGQFASTGS